MSDRDGNEEIYVMNTDGSDLTRLTENYYSDSFPSWAPSSAAMAFVSTRDGNAEIYIMNADGNNQTRLTDDADEDSHPSWGTGNWLAPIVNMTSVIRFSHNSVYISANLASTGLTTPVDVYFEFGTSTDYGMTTPPQQLLIPGDFSAEITSLEPGQLYHFRAVADGGDSGISAGTDQTFTTWTSMLDGKIAFCARLDGSNYDIYEMNADGVSPIRLTHGEHGNAVYSPDIALSPDGSKIAFRSSGSSPGIYVMNSDGSNQIKLTSDGREPVWSPDGSKIAFSSIRVGDGNKKIYIMNADGSNQTRITSGYYETYEHPSWSPDGTKIVCTHYQMGRQLYVVVSDGSNQAYPITSTGDYWESTWSPDEDKIAFVSNGNIYLINSDGSNRINLTSNGGISPAWSPDGAKIVYLGTNDTIWSMNADGTNKTQILSERYIRDPSWSNGVAVPTVTTKEPVDINIESATLSGKLNCLERDGSLSVSFEWGIDTSYTGGNIAGDPAVLTDWGSFTASLTDLTPGQTYHYRAKAEDDRVIYGDDMTFTTNWGQLVFISAAQSIVTHSTSSPIQVQIQDIDGNPLNASEDIDIALTSTSITGKFDVNSDGDFSGEISHITIMGGSNSAKFYYLDTTVGMSTISASCIGLNQGLQKEKVIPDSSSRLSIITEAFTLTAGETSGLITVQRQDRFGNPVSEEPDLTIYLSSNSIGKPLFRDSADTTDIDIVTIESGNSTTSFRYKDTKAGGLTITAACDALIPANQDEVIVFGEFSKLKFSDFPTTATVGKNYEFTLDALDSFGNNTSDYTGVVHFSSSDKLALLPADYQFSSIEGGIHIFSVTFKTVGKQSFSASDIATGTIVTQNDISVERKNNSGGGGSGGGGSSDSKIYTVDTAGLATSSMLCIDKYGIVQNDSNISSDNGNIELAIVKNTKLTYANGSILEKLSIIKLASPSKPPVKKTILRVYEFGPEGATFNPGVTLTLKYDPKALTEGSTLELAFWDGYKWKGLESQIDATAGKVVTQITHFSQYALLAEIPLVAAKFEVSNLKVSSMEVKAGEKVTVQIDITNVGGNQGQYNIILNINGYKEANRQDTLEAHQRQRLSFDIYRNAPGNYVIDINGSTASFTVMEPASLTSIPNHVPTTTVSQSVPTEISQVPQSSTSQSSTGSKPNIFLFLILGLVIVVIVTIISVIKYRRSRS